MRREEKREKSHNTTHTYTLPSKFQYQMLLMMSEPEKDFRGGKFYIETLENGSLKRTYANPQQNELVIFEASKASSRGGYHGMERVEKGERDWTSRVAISIGLMEASRNGDKKSEIDDKAVIPNRIQLEREKIEEVINEIDKLPAGQKVSKNANFARKVLAKHGRGDYSVAQDIRTSIFNLQKQINGKWEERFLKSPTKEEKRKLWNGEQNKINKTIDGLIENISSGANNDAD